MSTIVVMPGGFHPFHAGHAALYNSARRAFPDAEVFVAATNDTSTRPFPFAIKEKLAKLAGVEPGHFVQVKSPFRAQEITANFNPEVDKLIFVRSEKDADKQPQAGGVKKDGNPAYLQPLLGATNIAPFSKHAYMAYLPTVEFGPGMTSATEIRGAWPQLNEKRKTALVMSLYPKTQTNPKLAATVVKLLDTAMGGEELKEFAPGSGDDRENDPEDVLFRFAKMWYSAPDVATQRRVEQALAKVGWEIGELESEEGGAFVMRVGDEDGDSYLAWSEEQLADHLNEFAPDEGGGARKFIPWPEFIEQLKQILQKDFSCKENIVKSTIKARFVPHDPLEFGPTMLYSYYETRGMGRDKGAISTRGSIQVGKYTKGGLFGHTPDQLLTGFHLLKGHPFERHFDLTFDNIYKIANIIQGNTQGALEFKTEVAETTNPMTANTAGSGAGLSASYQRRENQPIAEKSKSPKVKDTEMVRTQQFVKQHYPTFSGDPEIAFDKWVMRSLKHSEQEDTQQDKTLARLTSKVELLSKKLNSLQTSDYVEESSRKK